MSDERDGVGTAMRVLGKLGLVEMRPVRDDAQEPKLEPTEPLPGGNATPDALEKLRADIGLQDDASPYRQFLVIADTLVAAIPDASARFKAAMDVASKTHSVTPDIVLAEFADRRQRLEAEGKRREAALEALLSQKVDPKQARLAEARGQLDVKRRELAELEATEARLASELAADETAFRGLAADMGAALDAIKTEIVNAETVFRANLGLTE